MELGIVLAIIAILVAIIMGLPSVLNFFGIQNHQDLHPKKWFQKKPAKPRKIHTSYNSNSPFYIDKLNPIPDKNKIVGRDADLQKITDAIAAQKHAIAVVAFGGIGKTTLVRLWLDNLLARENHGFEKVFAWSFYSQGAHETQNSSANFFEAALPFFGEKEIPQRDEEKAERLTDLVFKQQAILVLDGLEPLQEPSNPDDEHSGTFKDAGIQRFLFAIRRKGYTPAMQTVVLMTSRQDIKELQEFKDIFQPIDLRQLSDVDGVKLLRFQGVLGTDAELEKVSGENHGHALTLALLGQLVVSYAKRRSGFIEPI